MTTAAPSDRLICFDLGGVILRICRSWEEALTRAGVPIRSGVDVERLASDATCLAELREYQAGTRAAPTLLESFARQLTRAYTADELARANHAWIIDEYPGALTLVTELRDAGHDLAVLSNTSHEHWLACIRYPAFRALRRRHASHILGCCKPEDSIYAAFEESTGRRGDEIIFFDDTAPNVEAAQKRGWHAHHIDHTGDPVAQMRTVLDASDA